MRKFIVLIGITVAILLYETALFTDDLSLYEIMRETQDLYSAGEYAQAEENCKRALEDSPDFYHAYNILGSIYAQQNGMEQDAIDYFAKSAEINPRQAEVLNHIGSLYNKIGNVDEAVLHYKKSIEIDPGNFYSNFNLGILYLVEKQDAFNAVTALQAALKQRPQYDRLLYLTGIAYLLTGENFAALESVTRLREIKNEYLATQLEEVIRRFSHGGNVDMTEVMTEYTEQPKAELEPPQSPGVTLGPPKTRVSGTGTVSVKREIQNVQSSETSSEPLAVPAGTIQTRVKVGGTANVTIQGRARPVPP